MFRRNLENVLDQIKALPGIDHVELFSRICFVSKASKHITGVEARTSVRIQSEYGEKQIISGTFFPSVQFFTSAFSVMDWTQNICPVENLSGRQISYSDVLDSRQKKGNIQIYFREWFINSSDVNVFTEGNAGFYEQNNVFFLEKPVFKEKEHSDSIILHPLQVYGLMQAGVLNACKKRFPVKMFHDIYAGNGGDDFTVYRGFRDISLKNYGFSVDVIKDEDICGICIDDMRTEEDILHFNNNGLTVCSIDPVMIESLTRVSRFFVFESEGYMFSLPYLKMKGIFQWA